MDYSQLIVFFVIIAVFWLMIIRPQQQRAKRQSELVASLREGEEIVTIGGIYATIVSAGEERLRVRVADGTEFEIARGAVGSVIRHGEDADGAPTESDAQDTAEKDSDV